MVNAECGMQNAEYEGWHVLRVPFCDSLDSLFTCVPVYLSTCLPVYLFTCLPVYLCTCVPVYLAYDNCLRTSKKPGKVLETQAGSSIVTPGTRRPMSENAIAMR